MPRGRKAASAPAPEVAPAPAPVEEKVAKVSRRGRPSQVLTVPVNRQTLSILETCVTLGQATSTSAVAAKLLARAAEDLKNSIAQQVSNNFLGKDK